MLLAGAFATGLVAAANLPSTTARSTAASDAVRSGDPGAKSGIEWISLKEALERNAGKRNRRKILIDFYTDWCGWCKRMDQTTFSDPVIVEYVNEHFWAVKFDAEQKEPVDYLGQTYTFMPGGRRGTHGFALSIASISGRIGYPTIAFLDEEGARLATLPGYQDAARLDLHLKYYGGNYHEEFDLSTFRSIYDSPIE